jgi:hypothetical protein
MSEQTNTRASDADRAAIADRLRRAAAEGRLLVYELDERLEAALQARTYGELEALIADLHAPEQHPSGAGHAVRPRWALIAATAATFAAIAVAVVFVLTSTPATTAGSPRSALLTAHTPLITDLQRFKGSVRPSPQIRGSVTRTSLAPPRDITR